MLKGIDIQVLRRVEGAADEMGEPTITWQAETVSNVLVAPSENDRIEQSGRVLGTDDTLNVYFPKTYTDSLKNCKLGISGSTWDVLGDPNGFIPSQCPTSWNRRVVARKVEG